MVNRAFRRITIAASLLSMPWMMGQRCAPVPPPSDGPNEQLVFSGLNAAMLSISGTSATDIYAVGADPGDGSGPYLLHHDGTAWQRPASGASGDLWWISATPISGDFYMAGTEGKVLRFSPSTGSFTALATPTDDTAFGAWGTDASNLWAVGGNLSFSLNDGVLAYIGMATISTNVVN